MQHGKIKATLPKDTDPDSITLEIAVEMLVAKGGKPAKKPKKKAAVKKKAAAKKKKAAPIKAKTSPEEISATEPE